MAIHNDTGAWGEQMAARYFEKSGYTIIERNWRFRRAEIDIIARNEKLLVFVEVKTRTGSQWKSPEESIDARKRKLLFEAADAYLQNFPDSYTARFDVITVVAENGEALITHYPDALNPELF
ncbi:MAG TPA: YraN family protein [Bacteroidales bacterium]|nr:YraN family protein [Bacteroidales bacterium]HQL70072.1 YraN family protein [Bacteroidales bacterium]